MFLMRRAKERPISDDGADIHRGSAESRPFFLSFYYQGKHHCESDKKRWNIDSGADKWESGRGGT